jgi:hypothetical protein
MPIKDGDRLCMVHVENWKPAPGKTRLQALRDDFNVAADMIDDEYGEDGIMHHWMDALDRHVYRFLSTPAYCEELKKKHPRHFTGPHPAVIALTGG